MNTKLNEIFIPTNKEDDELSYESTSEYVSSDGAKKTNKKKLETIKIITKIPGTIQKKNTENPEKKISEETKSNKIIINKRTILLIKGGR